MARSLGVELDAWQRERLDVALEVDDRRHLVYSESRQSIGRQNGKTLMWFVVAVDRAVAGERRGWGRRQRIPYAAQTGQMAREKMLDTFVPVLADSQLGRLLRFDEQRHVNRTNGHESIAIGSARLMAMQGGKKAGHGGTNHMAGIDEAFAHADSTTEVGVGPTMLVPDSTQLWVQSAAGKTPDDSPYWWDKLTDLRERAESGQWGTVCGYEYRAPDDADLDDREVWRLTIPSLASGRLTIDDVWRERDRMADGDFNRTMLNRWGGQGAKLIGDAQWQRWRCPDAVPVGLHLGIDVCPDETGTNGRATSLTACGLWDGRPTLVVLDSRDGTGWVKAAVKDLDRQHRFRTVAMDSVGPVRALIDPVRSVIGPTRTKVMGTADACAAAQVLHQAIVEGPFAHRGQAVLDLAADGARKRPVADSWVFGRRASTSDVAPLVAGALAMLQLQRSPEPAGIM